MIPITETTITAIAALLYNYAYDQEPDTGWLAHDELSAPAHEPQWLEWSRCLIQVLQEQPESTDGQVIAQAKQRVDRNKVGWDWDSIPINQDSYSTISNETSRAMYLVRHFLEQPESYVEFSFIEEDPTYLASLTVP